MKRCRRVLEGAAGGTDSFFYGHDVYSAAQSMQVKVVRGGVRKTVGPTQHERHVQRSTGGGIVSNSHAYGIVTRVSPGGTTAIVATGRSDACHATVMMVKYQAAHVKLRVGDVVACSVVEGGGGGGGGGTWEACTVVVAEDVDALFRAGEITADIYRAHLSGALADGVIDMKVEEDHQK